MRKKKILIVNSTLHIGGAEYVIANLCRNLDSDFFDITVCHLKEGGVVADLLKSEGYKVVGLTKAISREKPDYFSPLHLFSYIVKNKIDLVHSHDIHSQIETNLCKFFYRKLKSVHTFHYGNYPERPKKYLFLEKQFGKVADCLVAVGNEQKRRIIETFGFKDDKVKIIWNGVENNQPSEINPKLDVIRKENKTVIGVIGTLIKQKGLFDLLIVIANLKAIRSDFNVVIAGGGYQHDELISKIREYGLAGHVHMLGWVQNAKSCVLPYIDVFLQTSLWEAMSMVVIEAMSAGKPVVATDVGDNKHMVLDGICGYISKAGDIDSLTQNINTLISDIELRKRFGREALLRYEKLMTAKAMADNYSNLYRSLLG